MNSDLHLKIAVTAVGAFVTTVAIWLISSF